MGIPNVGGLSLGQFSLLAKAWQKRQSGGKPGAPTEDEFDRAVMAARGVH
jgi:hypothetical protein